MRILITGITGFVGSRIARRLVDDHEVFGISRRDTSNRVQGVTYLRVDIRAISPVDVPESTDVVIHQAALIDNPFGAQPSLADLAMTNVLGTLAMLKAASVAGVRRFVHGSSQGVVGLTMPDSEGSVRVPSLPTDDYGLTKHLAERALFDYEWGMEVTSLRYFAPYAREGTNPLFSHLVECIERGTTIDVGIDGSPMLRPVHISDAVEATVSATTGPPPPSIVDVVGLDRVSLADLAQLLATALGSHALISYGPDKRPSRIQETRVAFPLGEPKVGLREGIRMEFGGSK